MLVCFTADTPTCDTLAHCLPVTSVFCYCFLILISRNSSVLSLALAVIDTSQKLEDKKKKTWFFEEKNYNIPVLKIPSICKPF